MSNEYADISKIGSKKPRIPLYLVDFKKSLCYNRTYDEVLI